VPVACLRSHRAGDRCGGAWWGLLIGVIPACMHTYSTCRYSPPWLLVAVQTYDFFLHYYFREFSDYPPRHRCLVSYCRRCFWT
jgi:hypothetical protein